MIPTLTWTPEGVRFIDQTKLPLEESYVLATTYEQVADVIVTMVVRGAPAIGVSAAMASPSARSTPKPNDCGEFAPEFEKICARLAGTRPTAVNLFWAIDRMKALFARLLAANATLAQIQEKTSRRSATPCTTKTSPPARRWAHLAPNCCRTKAAF